MAKFALAEATLRAEAWVVTMVFSLKERGSVECRDRDENYSRTAVPAPMRWSSDHTNTIRCSAHSTGMPRRIGVLQRKSVCTHDSG